MRSALGFATLGLGATASASAIIPHILPRTSHECCFTLTAHGPKMSKGPTGILGQLSDGQNRVGGKHPPATYCLDDGKIVDKNHRGCILTPPTTQFQCDEGATPTPGFDAHGDGSLVYKNNPEFWACPVNDFGEWNVYTSPAPGQKKCVQIKLTASGTCRPSSAASSVPSKPSILVGPSTPGEFEFPHLIVPVDEAKPGAQFGNKLNGTVTPSMCTAFNFDIHPDHAGKTCSLLFLLPKQGQLETSAFDLKGQGDLVFWSLKEPVGSKTSFKSLPERRLVGVAPAVPGTKTLVATRECPAGQKIGMLMCGSGIELNYFQDFNPAPIGLYIRQC
ncbi:ubiquitin 3 binding protein But2 C-terminal domain-domain-containing protein [Clohesyomyces aquaticus]|uniref:Ubiquitin 3 binding protein But2 C-terminal domain-domain-containing protein n=1 Tax=Clohesyomyces aquaticus TaxID=1231657 RepID=A0A1Y1ZNW7_9PLEO|nr:ubiquitin 3 binding protein But2 C-terminal domain-domain-containing protein [Clohesyomyces aquaticus]